jgi:polar amino acid transport system substrate-binding protein
VQRATISSNYIEDTYGDTVTISAYDTQENAYLDLLAGRIDLVLGDLFVQDTWLKTDLGKSFEFKGEPVINTDLVGIAIRKNSNDLKVKFNQAIDNIRANGIYKQINDKYFATDIY